MQIDVVGGARADALRLDAEDGNGIDALVLEEDTDLILIQPPIAADTSEHPIRLMTALYATPAHCPGTIIIKREVPLRILAIVHDLALDPSTRV